MEEEWMNLLKKVELSKEINPTNVLKKIKEVLKVDRDLYEDWEQNEFGVNHLLKCSVNLDPVKKDTKKERNQVNGKEIPNSQTLLHLFSKFGFINIVMLLVKYGADVNKTNINGSTPLLLAAVAGKLDIVKELINNGAKASMNEVNLFGKSPLLYAMKLGHVDIANFLMDNGAEIGIESKNNTKVFHYAAMHNLDIVKHFIHLGADISVRNIYGKTPLHYSVKSGKIDILKLLIKEKDVDVSAVVDGFGTDLVQYAAKFGQLEVLKYLVEELKLDYRSPDKLGYSAIHYAAAAPIDSLKIVKYLVEDKGVHHNVLANNTLSPMFCASERSNMEVMKYLLEEKHVSVHFQDKKEGYTALYLVCINEPCSFEAVKYLTEKHANFNTKTMKRRTPVQAAAYHGRLDVIKYLVEEVGAKVHNKDIFGHNELSTAVEQGQLEAVKYFIEKHNMGVGVIDRDRRSILYLAVQSGNLDLVKYLINEKGANKFINFRRADNGWTPLHESTSKGYEDITEFLVKEGARVNVPDNAGIRPIHKAAAIGSYKTIEALFKYYEGTVYLNGTDDKGDTPLHKAAKKGDYKTVKLLVEKGVKVNIENNAKETAKNVAVKYKKQDIVDYLDSISFDLNRLPSKNFVGRRSQSQNVNKATRSSVEVNCENRLVSQPATGGARPLINVRTGNTLSIPPRLFVQRPRLTTRRPLLSAQLPQNRE